MKQSEIESWAQELTEKIFQEWESKYSFWKSGFEVFYSPVMYKPKLMIISLNPGGTQQDFKDLDYTNFQNNNFAPPVKNRYVTTDYRFAKKMRDLFKGYEKVLEKSVVTTTLLFRSKSISFWKKENPKESRLAMEKFAYDQVKEMLEEIQPKKLLVVGIGAYKRLEKHVITIEGKEKEIDNFDSVGRVISAKTKQIDIMAIPHITGARLSNENMNKIKKYLSNFLK